MDFEAGLQKLQDLTAQCTSDATKYLASLFDDGSFTELDKFTKNGDVYCDVVTAYGLVGGVMTFAFAQNSGIGGAMGRVLSAKIKKVYTMAQKVGAPVISIFNSDGAHIDEGIEALEAYGELMAYTASLSGVVPQISVVLGTCVGASAMMAVGADVVIMEKNAEMYVTSGTILGEKSVGTSELAANNGTAAYIAENDGDALEKVKELISFLPQNNLSTPYFAEYIPSDSAITSKNADEVIAAVTDANSFCELYKDYAVCAKVGFARINGVSVGIVATNTDGEKICAAGADKMARFVRFLDAFSIPVITFVDSVGILGNTEDEVSGGVKSASKLSHAYAEATTAKITVITGAACGAIYIALCSKAAGIDSLFAWPTAYVSVLEPKTAVEFLLKDKLKEGVSREDAEKEYIEGEASAIAAAQKGFIEDIVNPLETAPKLSIALDCLSSKRVSTLNKKHSNIQL